MALFVPEYLWVRVFVPSGLVHRPSDRMSVRTIPLSGYMERRYRYKPEDLLDRRMSVMDWYYHKWPT